MNAMESNVMLAIVVSPALSHEMVDWLLANTSGGYFSYTGRGHGAGVHEMTLAEQVAGRQNKEIFQIHCLQSEAESMVEQLTRDFAGAGLHYWVVPVIAAGSL